jgi:hypothetical protein
MRPPRLVILGAIVLLSIPSSTYARHGLGGPLHLFASQKPTVRAPVVHPRRPYRSRNSLPPGLQKSGSKVPTLRVKPR